MRNAKYNLLFTLRGSRRGFAKKLLGSAIVAWYSGNFFLLLFCLLVLPSRTFAQGNYELRGTVVDEQNNALAGAAVFLEPLKDGTATDEKGIFVFNDLPKGTYVINISFIGYRTPLSIPCKLAGIKATMLN